MAVAAEKDRRLISPPTSSSNQLKDVEVYGFVGWIGTFVAYGLFLLWAYVPEPVLHELGITYYPDKHWAVTVPAFLVVCFLLVGMFYASLNLLSTAPLTSFHTITDSHSRGVWDSSSSHGSPHRHQRGPRGGRGGAAAAGGLYYSQHALPLGVPNIADLNIGVVNHILYQQPPPPPPRPQQQQHRTSSSSSSSQQQQQQAFAPATTTSH